MLTLGIETSCDETAAAVVENGRKILSSCISSSIQLHSKFGGIVPEIASRFHLEYIMPVAQAAFKKAGIKLADIDLIAVTYTPGLVGSLLVGLSFAKALSFALNKPYVGINHIHAHMFSAFLEKQSFRFPFIGLVVSGGHTTLAYVSDFNKIKIIGQTRDDAAGEAFDKVAKILELGYPGGPQIDRLAQTINASPYKFSCARLEDTLDFSFSGIKTDVLYTVQKLKKKSKLIKAQIAYSFQKEVIDIIAAKTIAAGNRFHVNILSVGGGVACNRYLRQKLSELGTREKAKVLLSKPEFCIDNGAMIASLGYFLYKKGARSKYSLTAVSTNR